jgi:LPXTG-motif cell wall-anchored protein
MSLFAEDSLISGLGTSSDFVNLFGNNAVNNQTAFDQADNGTMSQGSGTAQVTSPGWMSSLFSTIQSGASIYGQVAPLINGTTTAPQTTAASVPTQTANNTGAGAASGPTSAAPNTGASKTTIMVIIGAVLALVAVLFFAFRK